MSSLYKDFQTSMIRAFPNLNPGKRQAKTIREWYEAKEKFQDKKEFQIYIKQKIGKNQE